MGTVMPEQPSLENEASKFSKKKASKIPNVASETRKQNTPGQKT